MQQKDQRKTPVLAKTNSKADKNFWFTPMQFTFD